MIGYGANVGSGFPTIISAWKDAQWGEHELKNKIEVDEVELVLPIPVGGANDRVNDGRNDTVNDGINPSLMAILTIIKLNPGIQQKAISDISGKSIPTIERYIAALIKRGMIEHQGSKKTGGYYAK